MQKDKNRTDSAELAETEEALSASADKLAEAELDKTEIKPENDDNIETPEEEVDPAEGGGDTDPSGPPKEKESPGAQAGEPETAPAPVVKEPFAESMTYVGLDSTAMIDIAYIEVDDDDDDDNPLDDWIGKLEKSEDGEEPDKDEAIKEGVKIAGTLTAKANKVINMANKNYAERAIEIGIVCNILKKLQRGSDEPWGVWAEKQMPFLGKRNRQKFMRLANRSDCHDFPHLGVDRLDVLCSLTEGSTADGSIGALLRKYKIPFDDTSEVNMTEFRNQIDAAISNERLIKKGLEIDFTLVKNAVDAKVSFDTALISKMKAIQDSEGKPEKYVKALTVGQGSQGSDDPGTDPEKRFQDFNSLSSQLVKTIDYIVKDTDHIDTLDKDIFINLYEKINALLTASGIEIKKKEGE